MTNYLWKNNSADPCPSCQALNGQIHPIEVWDAHALKPKSHLLYCREHCHCTLEETELDETGDLSATPLRHVASVTLSAAVGGGYEVIIISPGQAISHPWHFSAAVLERATHLFDGIYCYIDHEQSHIKALHSAADLAGRFTAARYMDGIGITATLTPLGPSAETLRQLADAALMDPENTPIGISADMDLTSADGKTVSAIVRVRSADAVLHPARGGKFLHALLSSKGKAAMETPTTQPPNQEDDTLEQMKALLSATEAQRQAETQRKEMEKTHLDMCGFLLESGLNASGLPAASQKSLRAQFSGKVFTADELTAAISAKREEISEIMGADTATGIVRNMQTGADNYRAAFYDMLGADRPEELKTAKPARLSGIREAYTLATGDYDFRGGIHRAQLATSADMPNLLADALNKMVLKHWQELGRAGYDWWEKIVSIEPMTNLQPVKGILVGEVTLLPAVAEGAAYTALAPSDSKETGAWAKYGGYVGLTIEMFEKDETHKLRQYPQKLASSGLRRISNLVAAVFTANSGAGPVMSDSLNLFHTTHANLLTTALSAANWDAAQQKTYNQSLLVASGGTAPKLGLNAKYLVVPRALELTAKQILYPTLERASQIYTENQQRGEPGDVITCPEFTDANDWAAVVDPRLAPGIIVAHRFGIMPELYMADQQVNGALFTNDEIRIKARHFLSVFAADYRPLVKSNVA